MEDKQKAKRNQYLLEYQNSEQYKILHLFNIQYQLNQSFNQKVQDKLLKGELLTLNKILMKIRGNKDLYKEFKAKYPNIYKHFKKENLMHYTENKMIFADKDFKKVYHVCKKDAYKYKNGLNKLRNSLKNQINQQFIIPQVFQELEEQNQTYIIIEQQYFTQSIEEILKKDLNKQLVFEIINQCIKIIDLLKDSKIQHNNIKASNLFYENGTMFITDFNIINQDCLTDQLVKRDQSQLQKGNINQKCSDDIIQMNTIILFILDKVYPLEDIKFVFDSINCNYNTRMKDLIQLFNYGKDYQNQQKYTFSINRIDELLLELLKLRIIVTGIFQENLPHQILFEGKALIKENIEKDVVIILNETKLCIRKEKNFISSSIQEFQEFNFAELKNVQILTKEINLQQFLNFEKEIYVRDMDMILQQLISSKKNHLNFKLSNIFINKDNFQIRLNDIIPEEELADLYSKKAICQACKQKYSNIKEKAFVDIIIEINGHFENQRENDILRLCGNNQIQNEYTNDFKELQKRINNHSKEKDKESIAEFLKKNNSKNLKDIINKLERSYIQFKELIYCLRDQIYFFKAIDKYNEQEIEYYFIWFCSSNDFDYITNQIIIDDKIKIISELRNFKAQRVEIKQKNYLLIQIPLNPQDIKDMLDWVKDTSLSYKFKFLNAVLNQYEVLNKANLQVMQMNPNFFSINNNEIQDMFILNMEFIQSEEIKSKVQEEIIFGKQKVDISDFFKQICFNLINQQKSSNFNFLMSLLVKTLEKKQDSIQGIKFILDLSYTLGEYLTGQNVINLQFQRILNEFYLNNRAYIETDVQKREFLDESTILIKIYDTKELELKIYYFYQNEETERKENYEIISLQQTITPQKEESKTNKLQIKSFKGQSLLNLIEQNEMIDQVSFIYNIIEQIIAILLYLYDSNKIIYYFQEEFILINDCKVALFLYQPQKRTIFFEQFKKQNHIKESIYLSKYLKYQFIQQYSEISQKSNGYILGVFLLRLLKLNEDDIIAIKNKEYKIPSNRNSYVQNLIRIITQNMIYKNKYDLVSLKEQFENSYQNYINENNQNSIARGMDTLKASSNSNFKGIDDATKEIKIKNLILRNKFRYDEDDGYQHNQTQNYDNLIGNYNDGNLTQRNYFGSGEQSEVQIQLVENIQIYSTIENQPTSILENSNQIGNSNQILQQNQSAKEVQIWDGNLSNNNKQQQNEKIVEYQISLLEKNQPKLLFNYQRNEMNKSQKQISKSNDKIEENNKMKSKQSLNNFQIRDQLMEEQDKEIPESENLNQFNNFLEYQNDSFKNNNNFSLNQFVKEDYFNLKQKIQPQSIDNYEKNLKNNSYKQGRQKDLKGVQQGIEQYIEEIATSDNLKEDQAIEIVYNNHLNSYESSLSSLNDDKFPENINKGEDEILIRFQRDIYQKNYSDSYLGKLQEEIFNQYKLLLSIKFEMGYNQFTDEGLKQISNILKEQTKLHSLFLNLENNRFTDKGIQNLIINLPKQLRVLNLDLSYNNLGHETLGFVLEELSLFTKLQSLRFYFEGITIRQNENNQHKKYNFTNFENIKHFTLSISDCQLESYSFEMIASLINQLTNLENLTLNFQNNSLSDECLSLISQKLHDKKFLTSVNLILMKNNITIVGLKELISKVENLNNLKQFDVLLVKNRIQDRDINEIKAIKFFQDKKFEIFA